MAGGNEKRTIGEVEVSLAGLGCNNFGRRIDGARTRAVVDAALDAGVTLFDTADKYADGASEELLGRALRGRRDEAVILTKFGMFKPLDGLTGGDPRWVARACDDSLRRLGTDRIDLFMLHEPDPATPIADTLAALGRLVGQGKVREIACSNFSAGQLDEAAAAAAAGGLRPFAAVENEYSLLVRGPERGVLDACERLGTGFIPTSRWRAACSPASIIAGGRRRRARGSAATGGGPPSWSSMRDVLRWRSAWRRSPRRAVTACSSSPCRGWPSARESPR